MIDPFSLGEFILSNERTEDEHGGPYKIGIIYSLGIGCNYTLVREKEDENPTPHKKKIEAIEAKRNNYKRTGTTQIKAFK